MRKGQTCFNCAGDCCTLRGKAPPGSWLNSHFRQCRVKTISRLGGSISTEADEKYRCFRQLPNGRCSDYGHRPRLCRSFFCYGRLWRPKSEERVVDIVLRREQLKNFCVSQLAKLFDKGQFDRFVELLERGEGPFTIDFKLVLSPEAVKKIKEMK